MRSGTTKAVRLAVAAGVAFLIWYLLRVAPTAPPDEGRGVPRANRQPAPAAASLLESHAEPVVVRQALQERSPDHGSSARSLLVRTTDGAPIPGARVAVRTAEVSTSPKAIVLPGPVVWHDETDAKGRVSIPDAELPDGVLIASAEAVGFEKTSAEYPIADETIALRPARAVRFRVRLSPTGEPIAGALRGPPCPSPPHFH